MVNSEKTKDILKDKLNSNEENLITFKETINKLELDAWKSKNTVGKLLNAAFEFGGAEFLDQIEQYIQDSPIEEKDEEN